MIITLIAAVFGVVSSAHASSGRQIWTDKIEISDFVHYLNGIGLSNFK